MVGLPSDVLDSAFRMEDKNEDEALGASIRQQVQAAQTPTPSFKLPSVDSLLGGDDLDEEAPVTTRQLPVGGWKLPDLASLLGPSEPKTPQNPANPAQTPQNPAGSAMPSGAATARPAAMPTGAPTASGEIDNSSRQSFAQSAYPYALRAAGGDRELANRMLASAISENGSVGSGQSLGVGFNFGGIKYDPDAASSTSRATWESEGGQRVNQNATFANYNSPQEGFDAIPRFLQRNFPTQWAEYQRTGDSKALYRNINAGGYATDQNWHSTIENIAANQVAPHTGQAVAAPQARQGAPAAPPAAQATPQPGQSARVVPNATPNSYWTSGGTHGGAPAADIFAPEGSPIYAPVGGTSEPAVYPSGGNATTIKGDDGRYYYMAHGHVPFVGGRIEAGQPIGQVGRTGNARGTDPHLHYAIASNPSVFNARNGSGDIEGEAYWKTPDGVVHSQNDGHNHAPPPAAPARPVPATTPRPTAAVEPAAAVPPAPVPGVGPIAPGTGSPLDAARATYGAADGDMQRMSPGESEPPDDGGYRNPNLYPPVRRLPPGDQPYDSTDREGADTSIEHHLPPMIPNRVQSGFDLPPDAIYRQPLSQQPELPADQPYDPDQGPREGGREGWNGYGASSGVRDPSMTPAAGGSSDDIPLPASPPPTTGIAPTYASQASAEEEAQSASRQPAAQPQPQSARGYVQGAAEGIKRAATGLYEAAQNPQNAIDTVGAAAGAAGQAIVDEAYPTPEQQTANAGKLPMQRGLELVQAAMDAGNLEIGRRIGRAAGLTKEELLTIFGIPVSGEDIAGFVGSAVLDPTNLIGAGPATRTARAAVKAAAPVVRSGVEAAGRGAMALGREGAEQLMDLAPQPRMAQAGEGGGRPTVEVLREQLGLARRGIAAAREGGDAGVLARAQDRAAEIESQLADAMNARRGIEPAIASDVGRRVDDLPLTEETADALTDAQRATERVREKPSDFSGPVGIPTNMAGRQNAALPFDPASAAAGGAAGAMGEDGEEGDPARTAAGALAAGVLGRKFPGVQRAVQAAQQRQANMTAQGLKTPSVWEWIKQAGYAGIYGPSTFVSSVAGGAQEMVLGAPKEAIRALVSGRPGSYGKQAKAQLRALPDGLTGLGRVLWGSDSAATAAASGGSQGTADISERVVNPIGHFAARVLERPGEIMTEAPDAVFRPMFLAQGMQREADTIAAEMGMRGAKAASYAETLMQSAETLRANPSTRSTSAEAQRVVKAGADYADELGYKGDPGGFGRWLGQTAKRDDAIGVMASFLVPFPSMASRVTRSALRSTPGVGLLPSIRGGQPTKFDVAYDQAFGTLMAGGIGYWAFNGGITGSGPADTEKRKMMIAEGWQPKSTLVAGHYIPNRVFQRFGPMLDTAGELHDALAYGKKDRKTSEVVAELVKRVSSVATDQVGLSGLADLHDMLDQGFASQFPGWAARSAARYVPYAGILRAAATSQDTKQRKAQGWGDEAFPTTAIGQNLEMAVPGLRQNVPAVQDVLGREAANPQQGFGAIIPKVTTQQDDPVISRFQEAGVDIGAPKTEITDLGVPVALTPAETRSWNTLRGAEIIKQTEDISPQVWQSMTPARRVERAEGIKTSAAARADLRLKSDIGTAEWSRRRRETRQKVAS